MTAVPAVAEVRRTAVTCGDRTGTVIVDDDATVEIIVRNAEQEVVDTLEVDHMFGMTFESEQDPVRCCWIQFLWASVEGYYTAEDGSRTGFIFPGEITSNIGLTQLTTRPDLPDEWHWHLDSANPREAEDMDPEDRARATPCYDPAGLHARTGTTVTIWDKPGRDMLDDIVPQVQEILAQANRPESDHIALIGNFHTYLVCEGEICARLSWSVMWHWYPEPRGIEGPEYDGGDVETEDLELTGAQADSVRAGYPNQRWINLR